VQKSGNFKIALFGTLNRAIAQFQSVRMPTPEKLPMSIWCFFFINFCFAKWLKIAGTI